jgi:hypothetical protein
MSTYPTPEDLKGVSVCVCVCDELTCCAVETFIEVCAHSPCLVCHVTP